MSGTREKEQGEHRQAVVTGQIEKRSASTAHHISIITDRLQEIEKSGGSQSGDVSDDNKTVQSSDKTHDKESKQS